jgi:hypothetical protein
MKPIEPASTFFSEHGQHALPRELPMYAEVIRVEPDSPDSTPTEAEPDAMRWLKWQVAALLAETKSLSGRLDVLAHDLAESRAELLHCSRRESNDVEEKVTPGFSDHAPLAQAALDRSRIDGNSDELLQQHASLVNEISNLVFARLNEDPRISNLIGSHQSVQQSISKLMDMLDKPEQANCGQGHAKWGQGKIDLESLFTTMVDTQKSCKSIAVELRQLRQRRNQDCSDNTIRFGELERKLQAIESNISSDLTPTANAEATSKTITEAIITPDENEESSVHESRKADIHSLDPDIDDMSSRLLRAVFGRN